MPSLGFQLTSDGITPALQRLAGQPLADRVALAAATALAGLAQRAFDEPGLRPSSWPARKKPASHPLLLLSGTLRQSIHPHGVGGGVAEIRIPPVYAATHQLGSAKATGRGGGVPARPFFPATEGGEITDAGVKACDEVVRRLIGEG